MTSSVDLGVAPSSLKLDGLMMEFNRTAAQQAALNQLMADQKNPASPRYHQWLTPQQFGARFGLSPADIAKVTSWLTSQGFTVTGVAKSSTYVTFSGTAGQVQQAFGTTIHTLSRNGQSHVANLTDPVLPSAIADVVANISGLNDFHPVSHPRVNQAAANAVRPHFTAPGTNPPFYALAPADFNTIYDVNPLLSNGMTGAGIGKCSGSSNPLCADIVVVGQVDLNLTDVADIISFRKAAGLDLTNLPNKLVINPTPGRPSGSCATQNAPSSCHPALTDLQQSIMDLEWAGAIAPEAKLLFVTSTDVINTSLTVAIDNDFAPIISVSYGACETAYTDSQRRHLNAELQQATVQGITIISATGDDGATDCDNHVATATQGLAVDFPGSSPYVTALGGTMFDDVGNESSYWSSNNGPNGVSAHGYIPETVWNETMEDITQTPPTFGAGGGGVSKFFAKPAWQNGPGVPIDGFRDVPDISLNAASNHEGYMICVQGSCANGNFYNSSGGVSYGGTSLSSPAFAGIMALVEQKLDLGRLGNINPNIYAMANGNMYHNIFHDITSGNNNSPCTAGSTDCQGGGSIGYAAANNYDLASGWGSIDAAEFANEWTSFLPSNPLGTLTSQTVVSPTPSSAAAGTPISLAISVNSGNNTPTGTVEILLDGTTVAPSILLSSGHATYSLNTTNLTVGPHTVKVIYSGDSNFISSFGTTTITITGAGTGTIATQTTVIPTPQSVAAGTPISLAITVAPGSTSANSPSGTVQILVDGSGVASSVAVAGGHASYFLDTSALTGGSHTVTAVYAGDTNFTGSQGSTQITISVPAVGSDFTITPSTASVSAIIGEKLPPIVLKLTPVNGFTGPITLSASDTSSDQLTPTFSVNPVVINSTSSATTTLTFQTFKSLSSVRGEGQTFRHSSSRSAVGKRRWYAAGGGATLACMFLLVLPRRRRWGALLAVLVSIGAIGASGCGSGGTLPTSATYKITITATAAGNLVHTSMVNVTFRIR